MFTLLIRREDDIDDVYDPHGPFDTVEEAQAYAERFRDRNGLPREATPENNEAWTDAGWYFGIWPLVKEDFDPSEPGVPGNDDDRYEVA